jgi:hypothetical protein
MSNPRLTHSRHADYPGPSWAPVFALVLAASVLALIVNTMSRRSANGRVASTAYARRCARHQIHATRMAPAYGSPWARRVVVRDAR